MKYAILPDRGVIRVSGDDARDFLQGLVSNDVEKVSPDRSIYAAFLTPQGKYLFDFFIVQAADGRLLIDCEAARLDDFMRRLNMYKLRAAVDIEDVTGSFAVAAVFGGEAAASLGFEAEPGAARPCADGIAYVDPRLPDAGLRSIAPAANLGSALEAMGCSEAAAESYDAHRLALGLPDGSRDMEVDKAILLESGFEELHGLDWDKGCYMGQELTARTKYRGLVKKRLLPVQIEGPLPSPGTQITAGGKDAGEMRSGQGSRAIALLRLEAVSGEAPLMAGETRIIPHIAPWVALPEAE